MQEAAKIGARYMVNADLKHYFFQLGLPTSIRQLFLTTVSRFLAVGCYLRRAGQRGGGGT